MYGICDALTVKLRDSLLMKGRVQKHFLREATRPLLPEVVCTHSKIGFGIPLHRFQNESCHEVTRSLLAARDGPMGMLDSREVNRIRADGLTLKEDRADINVSRASHQLWSLVQLAAWTERFRVTA